METRIDRRKAVLTIGSVSLGALLAACGGDGGSEAVETATVPTSEGETATVEPQTATGASSELFDDTSSCVLTAEQTEGPFYFDVDSIRSDIRDDREGVPLRLVVRVREAEGCAPLQSAVVDVWHCDALGDYSIAAQPFLRGAQVANADGIAEFTTIYPGSYTGRTVHIHAKVHVDNSTVLTTQLYFDEGVTDAVHSRAPYARAGAADTSNASDGLFDEGLLLNLQADGEGYVGAISVDVRR